MNSGLCVEGCGRPAGSTHSPYFCPECNAERLERITKNLQAAIRRLQEVKDGR